MPLKPGSLTSVFGMSARQQGWTPFPLVSSSQRSEGPTVASTLAYSAGRVTCTRDSECTEGGCLGMLGIGGRVSKETRTPLRGTTHTPQCVPLVGPPSTSVSGTTTVALSSTPTTSWSRPVCSLCHPTTLEAAHHSPPPTPVQCSRGDGIRVGVVRSRLAARAPHCRAPCAQPTHCILRAEPVAKTASGHVGMEQVRTPAAPERPHGSPLTAPLGVPLEVPPACPLQHRPRTSLPQPQLTHRPPCRRCRQRITHAGRANTTASCRQHSAPTTSARERHFLGLGARGTHACVISTWGMRSATAACCVARLLRHCSQPMRPLRRLQHRLQR
jgi:hypothetical protein